MEVFVIFVTFAFINTALMIPAENCYLHHFCASVLAALLSLTTTVIFPFYFVIGKEVLRIVAVVFSGLSALAYLVDVCTLCITWQCYMASRQGLLQVCQMYVAAVVIVMISDPVSYKDHPAVIWCMAVYCVIFIGTRACMVSCVFFDVRNLSRFKLYAASMYLTITIIWPVYKLNNQDNHPESCQEVCPWTKLIIVATLTGLNYLLYSLGFFCFYTSDSRSEEDGMPSSSTEHHYSLSTNETQALIQHNPSRQLQLRPGGNLSQNLNQGDQGIINQNFNINIDAVYIDAKWVNASAALRFIP